MDVRPIRNEDDLTWAIGQIERYFDDPPPRGSPEADRFDVLSALISRYEDEMHPIPATTPIEVLRFAISDMGRSQAELAAVLGSRSRASEVLTGKRPLTLDMIRKISAAWRIPVEALMPRPSEQAA